MKVDLKEKVILVTGANAGIGKETARALAGAGATVVLSGRNPKSLKTAVQEIRTVTGSDRVDSLTADLSAMRSVVGLARAFAARHDRLDVLIHNAGVILSERRLTMDGFETTFAVNHLAPFVLTRELLLLLKESAPSRIVTVSSTAHRRVAGLDFEDLMSERDYRPFHVYGKSKLANILFTRALSRRLEGTWITANCLHPGVIRTRLGASGDLTGILKWGWRLIQPFLTGPRRGAETTVYLAASPDVEGVTGEYFSRCAQDVPTAAARDDAAAERLWEISTELADRALAAG